MSDLELRVRCLELAVERLRSGDIHIKSSAVEVAADYYRWVRGESEKGDLLRKAAA